MLTSVDVKFTSIVHLFREIQQIKVCSGLQIYSKEQMLSVELTSRCSCYVFRQYFLVKRVQCPPDSSAIFFKQPKQLNLVPRFPQPASNYEQALPFGRAKQARERGDEERTFPLPLAASPLARPNRRACSQAKVSSINGSI